MRSRTRVQIFWRSVFTADAHAQALPCVLFPILQMPRKSKKLISTFSNWYVKGKEGLRPYISIDLPNPGLAVDRCGKSEMHIFSLVCLMDVSLVQYVVHAHRILRYLIYYIRNMGISLTSYSGN